jgi:hypothetical protein
MLQGQSMKEHTIRKILTEGASSNDRSKNVVDSKISVMLYEIGIAKGFNLILYELNFILMWLMNTNLLLALFSNARINAAHHTMHCDLGMSNSDSGLIIEHEDKYRLPIAVVPYQVLLPLCRSAGISLGASILHQCVNGLPATSG